MCTRRKTRRAVYSRRHRLGSSLCRRDRAGRRDARQLLRISPMAELRRQAKPDESAKRGIISISWLPARPESRRRAILKSLIKRRGGDGMACSASAFARGAGIIVVAAARS